MQLSEDIPPGCCRMDSMRTLLTEIGSFLTSGEKDPDASRYGELVNFNKGKKFEEKHPCNASDAAKVKNPELLPWRRVIISTNAAETAVTFKGCWAVIDTCLVNQVVYDPVAKTQLHATVPCPKIASKQRAGRAGRTTPGINIKLGHSAGMG